MSSMSWVHPELVPYLRMFLFDGTGLAITSGTSLDGQHLWWLGNEIHRYFRGEVTIYVL